MAIAESEGLTVIPPFDHADVIAGQGTVGLEIVEDLPDVETVAVPVGGGGLAAGVAVALGALRPDARLYGVEPEGAATLTAALAAGRPVRLPAAHSVADGLLPLSVGAITFQHLRDRIVARTVTETAIVQAALWLRSIGVLAEPSGAATTAAWRSGLVEAGGPTVLVVSGGNVDLAVLEAFTTVAAGVQE